MPNMPSTFHTCEREKLFLHPSSKKFGVPELQRLVKPHIESFNSLLEPPTRGILHYAVDDIGVVEIADVPHNSPEKGNILKVWIEEVLIGKPLLPENARGVKTRQIYPSECRERMTTYAGKMMIKFCWQVNDEPPNTDTKSMGFIPIMIKSNRCNLQYFYSKQMIQHHEESEEMGGYFIINGIEKIIRLLLIQRRNYPMALLRPSFANRGTSYTEYGVSIRCARQDQTTMTNTLHYLKDGNCMLRFVWRKQEYIVPVIFFLKSLVEINDKGIYEMLMLGDFENTFMSDRVEHMLQEFKAHDVKSREQSLTLLGEKFRVIIGLPSHYSNKQVGEYVIKKVLLVHLTNFQDKFDLLIFMIRKLYSFVVGNCCPDNPDSPQNQEVLLGGHLYGMIIKEKLADYLNGIKAQILMDLNAKKTVNFKDKKYLSTTFNKSNSDIGKKLAYFLATGNLVSNTGLDLMQTTGYTIIAEKLNFFRYISHFRCVHRGSFFAELKTTTVRKLLPESWGFICPVHTPDGTPCGLLNHLSYSCRVITSQLNVNKIPLLLSEFGISVKPPINGKDKICVQLDGKILGWCSSKHAQSIADRLRILKIEEKIPIDIEIGFIPPSNGGQYPGIYIFSSSGRMMRPVKFLANGKTDMVGSFEQVYMNIACLQEDIVKGTTTHQEFSPTNILSILANLTPFSDYNQSPRNMYQCQMAKQTMGTPATALTHRTDNKLYRLQTGQTPIVRPELHNTLGLDGFPNGTNAIVAVVSYTCYDMEDAMIINKSSHERGFGYGTIYKSEIVNLEKFRKLGDPIQHHFGLGADASPHWREKLDDDGLPFIGIKITYGDPLCAYIDETKGITKVTKYKGLEDAYVDQVRLLGDDLGKIEVQKIHIKLRIPRPSVIGDKFSSRHGQKGILSRLWPQTDMPFTESGMQPDIIINPHAFPSRMTIGMFVESLAGKCGALFGIAQDCTPFKFNEEYTAIDYFGEQLLRAGYNYHGNEPMYSGITGEEFHADIYIGVVFYQRLRHMVSDKWQVRSTGPVHNLTMQPIGGRKKSGGVRFGEMERDSLLAHGMSFCLQDRLMNCSDYSQCHLCRKCGSIFTSLSLKTHHTINSNYTYKKHHIQCDICDTARWITLVKIPYAFRYLATELASMGIKIVLDTET
ncbi:9635_t:CDS:10 [Acaulospora morrowiae]|uniref:DNA-directed RNA polymerase subunit beta n=1 Tax=Acaulospora morrowiae TaxID=94023 RepID=A0A9N8WAX5_9GLOM|nr:9635_t:CDS:10 [Acaulospora morrowiae]